jgi:hypothetical protein
MRLAFRIFGALMILAISFTVTLLVMDSVNPPQPVCPGGTATLLTGRFNRFGASGYAYFAPAPAFEQFADSPDDAVRSKMTVCEEGRLLGPAHSVHADIVKIGRGRFSHWKTIGFIFSSSDNSDPNTNGRRYSVVSPR